LAPLGNYGGPTETMLPLPGSAAICAGSASLAVANGSPLTTDQRGFPLSPSSCASGAVDAGSVQSNYLTVSNTSDADDGSCTSTACSLRDALNAAAVDGDINFASGVTGTITLGSALPQIGGQVNIIGPGASTLTVSGGNSAAVGSIFEVNAGAQTSFSGLTIANGNTTVYGGGIFNRGTLAVSNSTFSGNSATYGGAIVAYTGTLSVSGSTFSGNSATAGGGGGIFNFAGSAVTVTNSTFAGNSATGPGGALGNQGTLVASDDTFSANSAANGGGGILNYSNGTVTLTNSIFSGNLSASSGAEGAGIFNLTGVVTANDNVFYNNLADGVEDDCNNCTTDSGAISADPMLAALGNYGGPTQTMLPLPGSAAICAGSTSLVPSGVIIDQRGFARTTSYSGTACVDAGAVQTNYQSIQFTNASSGYTGAINQAVSPAPTISVTENGQNIGGVPVTLTFSGSGTAIGLGPATTVGNTGATFSNLQVDTIGSDTLSATLQITPTFAITTNPTADLTITPTAQTITFSPLPSPVIYGAAPITLSATASSTLAVSFKVDSGPGSITGNTLSITGAGTITVEADQTGDSSYSAATPVMQAIVVNPATLNVVAANAARVYGAANPVFTGSATGFVNGDTATSTGLAYTTTATAASPRGTYPISAELINSTAAANYSLNITAGTLTITQATLTISVNSASRAYGAPNPAFTGSAAGFVNGDTAASTGLAFTTTATAASPMGTYPITAALTNITAAANYSLNIAAGKLTITRDTLTISVNSASRAYGAANPVFTGSATGFVNGDSATSTGLSYSSTAAAASPVGTYPITATLTNTTAAANYSLNITAGTLTVTRATLTISANSATRVYGAANPTFSGTVTGAVNGDTFTESFTTTATTASNAGTYAIVPSVSGAKASDYSETTQNGTLTVTQAASSTTLSASGNTINPGQSVTLTAHVQSATANTPSGPTGSVKFYEGTSVLGTSTLSGGTATYTTTALASGTTDNLTAVYLGDTNFVGSSSSGTTVSVGQLDFTLSVTGSASQTVTGGSPASYQLGVAPLYGAYAGPVSFAATGLPSGFAATFSPASLAANSGAQTVTVTVQTPMATAANTAPPLSERLAPVAFGLLLLPLTGMRKIRRRLSRHLLVILILLAGLGGVVGLSGCGSPAGMGAGGSTPQSYSFTVTASAGSLQHSASLTVEVK
ncbi:MAG: MBG domain-containing protein, partial [Silvibacterium sp.]